MASACRGAKPASWSSASSRTHQVHVVADRQSQGLLKRQRRRAPSVARRLLAPGVVHQDAAHGLGEDGEELHPAFELYLAAAQQTQEGLVDQGRGLQGVARALPRQVGTGQGPQVLEDQRHQAVERLPVAAAPGVEKLGDLRAGIGMHGGILGMPGKAGKVSGDDDDWIRRRAARPLQNPNPQDSTQSEETSMTTALSASQPATSAKGFPIYKQFSTTLKPGEWTGFSMGPATLDRAFVAAYKLANPTSNSGFLEKDVFQPEWDGKQWNTVLRLQMSKDVQPQPIDVCVYEIAGFPVVSEFETTLNPGEWQGHSMGPCSVNQAFVAAFLPSTKEGFLETHRFQPEWDGKQWNMVLRLQIPTSMHPMKLKVRVYQVNAPLYTTIDTTLKGGQWQGYSLGPATTDHGFLAGYELAKPQLNLGFLEKSRFQDEWDGKPWISALRLQISSDLPSIALKANVYAVGK